jgi:predicted NodU family carbamoyl transferase
MKILGITDMQTSGAAIIEDTHILTAINGERLVRKKMARGFPRQSIRKVLELGNIDPKEIDAVAVAQINGFFSDEILEWKGWFEFGSCFMLSCLHLSKNKDKRDPQERV